KYEAYRFYLQERHWHGIPAESLNVIIELDSTFYLPRIEFIEWNRTGLEGDNQRHFQFLDRHLALLSNYERARYRSARWIYSGEFMKVFDIEDQLQRKYPDDPSHKNGFLALNALKNPELALVRWQVADIGSGSDRISEQSNFRSMWMMHAACRIKDTTLIRNFYTDFKLNANGFQFPYWLAKIQGAALLNDERPFERYLDNYFAGDENAALYQTWILAGLSCATFFSNSQREKIQKAIIEFVDRSERKDELRKTFKCTLELMKGKIPVVDWESLPELPLNFQIWNLGAAGMGLPEKTNEAERNLILDRLRILAEPHPYLSPEHSNGASHYAMGLIYTRMRDYTKALEHLKIAFDLGLASYQMMFDFDYRLQDLVGMPGFTEMTQPVWPD
ncbi:MAG: hypothetical protein OEM26_14280, partial [Saprospiraceae bacterium]|nr:hypothetical protein [Saprospiraceae bacterium]